MKITAIASAVLACALMTGCEGSGKVGTERTTSSNGVSSSRVYVEMTISWKSAIDASMLAIDLSATNAVVVDGNGTVTVTLLQGGQTIGVGQFGYNVIDGMALVSDPGAVNYWLAGHPGADGYEVVLDDVTTIDTDAGVASLAVEAIYDGYVYGSASSSWGSAGGGGCGGEPGGGHDGGVFLPEMPIICP
ncbi:hypothetical protein [Luteimonas abyssi]|uniref:hypothetical protein n=1 Tax=Luteimonas abyssi TaxID=1247514 RepID=UPI000AD1694A|nr:hypothetical protein [Luteimonas abyssi]